MSLECTIVSKILETGDLTSLLRQKIVAESFKSKKYKSVYSFILQHYNSPQHQREIPSLEMVQRQFPWFQPKESSDSLTSLAEELRREVLRSELEALFVRASTINPQDPESALSYLGMAVPTLTREFVVDLDMDLKAGVEDLREQYFLAKTKEGMLGYPYPFECLNAETMGLCPNNLVILYGMEGSMKTWLELYIACYMYEMGRRVLIMTTEMTRSEIMQRIGCILARVDFGSFVRGSLQPHLEQSVFQHLDRLASKSNGTGRNIIITEGNGAVGNGGIMALRAKIEESAPECVFVDGIYRLTDDRAPSKKSSVNWEANTVVVQDLKETAKIYNVPVVGSTASNEDGKVAYSKAAQKEADLILLLKTVSGNPHGAFLDITVTKSRKSLSGLAGFRLDVRPGVVFTEVPGSVVYRGQENSPQEETRPRPKTDFRKFQPTRH